MTKTKAVIPHHQPSPIQEAQTILFSPWGLILVCGSILAIVAIFSTGQSQGKLGQGYWGGAKEKGNAQKKGRLQVANSGSKVGKTCLYINQPKQARIAHRKAMIQGITKSLAKHGFSEAEIAQKIKENEANLPQQPGFFDPDRTLYFPDCQQGTAVLGAAGTGKSFGILNPYLRSAIDQGLSIVLYDFKYAEQTKEIVGYAKEHGYNIQIFAPSFPETCTLNLLDFIKDSGDGVAAGQMAETMIKNLAAGDKNSGGNEFFENAGATLVKALFLASKWVAEQEGRPEIGDLMTAAAIAALPNLSARMLFAQKRLNVWNDKAFSQLVGVGGGKTETNVTEGGIIANASKVFQKFVEREFVRAICGVSDFNPDLEGKTLVVIGLNQDYRAILSPILATAIDTIVSRNIAHSRHRQTPLVVSLDELPSLYLPKLANWLAEARSAGFVGLLGLQNFSQLKEAYGDDRATTILGNCATKHFLNPQDGSSAKQYSEYLGEKEVVYWTKSINGAAGAGSKTSVSRSEQRQKVPLMTPEEFLKLPQGRAVTISPGYTNKTRKEGYIPILHDIVVAPSDSSDSKRSVKHWEKMVAQMRSPSVGSAASSCATLSDAEASKIMEERRQIVERLFPEPPPANGDTCTLSTLVKVAVEILGYEPPAANSYLDQDIPVYKRWFGQNERIDLAKLKQDADSLIVLLASHDIKLSNR